MTHGAGVLRSAESLADTDKELLSLQAAIPSYLRDDELELNNLFTVAYALLDAALAAPRKPRRPHAHRLPRDEQRLPLPAGDAVTGVNLHPPIGAVREAVGACAGRRPHADGRPHGVARSTLARG